MIPVASLDANVLFPMILRDTLLRVAAAGCYRPHWSDRILGEMSRNLLLQERITAEQAARLAGQMSLAFPDAEVAGWEAHEASMPNDPKDRHVAAAAVRIGAHVIVTANIRDFVPLPPCLAALTPDAFLLERLRAMPSDVVAALSRQASGYRDPPASLAGLLDWLERDLPDFVAAARMAIAEVGRS